jgi:hypothetical protein
VTKDWHRWYEAYDDPGSPLSRRLEVVRRDLRRALDEAPDAPDGVPRLTSICAGDGRDVLPILAEHDRGRTVRALLVELDPVLSRRARETAAGLGLSGVEVRTADAGATGTYRDVPPAQVVVACGVFGNVPPDDIRRTVAALPSLLVPDGIVIWTRGRGGDGSDAALGVRACFTDHGYREMAYTSPADAHFRVGMHRLVARPAEVPPLPPGRLFTFV